MSNSRRVPPPPTRFGVRPVQPKSAAPHAVVPAPPTRFGPRPVQPRLAPSAPASPPTRFGPAPVQARMNPARVIQRMRLSDISDDSSDMSDEEAFDRKPPTGMDHDYYKRGFQYHADRDDEKAVDAYEEMMIKLGGKGVGQTVGTKESDNYDDSYVDIPPQLRPAAPASLWKIVYAGLKASNKYKGFHYVNCDEREDGNVYVDSKTKCEDGTKKRPPMCHIVPFNHIRWAVSWLYQNKKHKYADNYQGPDYTGLDNDTWKKLVWHKSNLRPGHSVCNSKTAYLARGVPQTKDEKNIILYVAKRLKKIQPTWF